MFPLQRTLSGRTLFGDLPFAFCAKDGDGDDDSASNGDGEGDAGEFTQAQEAMIARIVNESVNKIIGSRLSRNQKQLLDAVASTVQKTMKDAGVKVGGDDDSTGDGDDDQDVKVPPSVARRLKEAEDQLAEVKQHREEQKRETFQKRVRGELVRIAKDKGVKDPEDLEFIADHFVERVGTDDADGLVVGDVALETRMDRFFSSGMGKRCIPANNGDGGGGGGETADEGGSGTGDELSLDDALMALVKGDVTT